MNQTTDAHLHDSNVPCVDCTTLLFDCFGVIARLQTPAAEHTIYTLALGENPNEVSRGSSRPRFTFEQLALCYRGLRKPYDRGDWDGPTYWRKVAESLRTSFTPTQIDDLIQADLESWSQVDDQMVEYLYELREAGYRMGLLSNIPRELAAIYRTKPWLEVFDSVSWSCDIGAAKPEKEAFQHAADDLGVSFDSLFFIDDSQENVAAAHKLGIRAYRYHHGEQLRYALSGGLI